MLSDVWVLCPVMCAYAAQHCNIYFASVYDSPFLEGIVQHSCMTWMLFLDIKKKNLNDYSRILLIQSRSVSCAGMVCILCVLVPDGVWVCGYGVQGCAGVAPVVIVWI